MASGAWRPSWDACVDPDVCKDGRSGTAVACNAGAGWAPRNCEQGQWVIGPECGVCGGAFTDPCWENKTSQTCFAAHYDGLTCGVWNENYLPPRCELSLNASRYMKCSDARSRSACRPILGCNWTAL